MTYHVGVVDHAAYECLIPKCRRPPVIRGVCKPCYKTLLRMIKKGQTTWERLEIEGHTKPPKRGLNPAYIAARISCQRIR